MQLSLLWLISVSLLLGGESSPQVLRQLLLMHLARRGPTSTTSKAYETEKGVPVLTIRKRGESVRIINCFQMSWLAADEERVGSEGPVLPGMHHTMGVISCRWGD